jgi:hypothetical protein
MLLRDDGFLQADFWTLVDLMRARATLEAEIWVLRQQINVLRRAAPRRQSSGVFGSIDICWSLSTVS